MNQGTICRLVSCKRNINVNGAKTLQLGGTFKENCPDIRNIHTIYVYHVLSDYGIAVDIYASWINPTEVKHE